MAKGGARLGAGAKKREPVGAWLAGHNGKPSGGKRPQALAKSAEGLDKPPQPPDNSVEGVWRELAPLAIAHGTLTSQTAPAFRLLCQLVVLEQDLRADQTACAGSNHRGILARVEAQLARFRIMPDGKPVVAAAPEVDDFAEFDGPALVAKGA